ncbi:YbaB/EbfC family DNA-binding protein [Amycolatopsis sp. lyj-109]|uniref:YbaB/EbfC family DNA-binding protein n=1 Tax=Amycolatopsis sp. lyj-109 TaxID=2789287 RepID=UPI00397AB4F1
MTNSDFAESDPARAMNNAWATFETEMGKLDELGKHWDEARSTVHPKDRSLTMTLDGRGELVELVFNGSKYRTLPPAQLAQIIVETLQKGRVEAQQKMSDLMGETSVPGLDLAGMAAGEVRPDEMIKSMFGQMLDGFGLDIDLSDRRPRKDGEVDG